MHDFLLQTVQFKKITSNTNTAAIQTQTSILFQVVHIRSYAATFMAVPIKQYIAKEMLHITFLCQNGTTLDTESEGNVLTIIYTYVT